MYGTRDSRDEPPQAEQQDRPERGSPTWSQRDLVRLSLLLCPEADHRDGP